MAFIVYLMRDQYSKVSICDEPDVSPLLSDGVHVPVLSVPEQLQVSEPKGPGARPPEPERVGAGAAAVHGQDGL